MSWLNTKVPLYSKLIALKDYVQLDKIFNKTLKQMAFICFLLLVVFYFFIFILRLTKFQIGSTIFADRFLDYQPMLLMMIPIFLQQFIGSWATYLRCHKREPFLINSIIAGILCMTSTLIFGNMYGLYGITIGYCTIQICMFPWGYWLFYSNKTKWHGK